MNTRFLETFVTLAELRSFRATAGALHATPSAVSLRIKNLEAALGTELVDRAATPFALTPRGEQLLDHARRVVDATGALLRAAGTAPPLSGRVRLGAVEVVAHSWLPDLVRALHASHPQLELELTVGRSRELEDLLRRRQLDLAVTTGAGADPAGQREGLASLAAWWVARPGLLAASAPDLARRVLDLPILSFSRGSHPYRLLECHVRALAAQHGLAPEQVRYTCAPSLGMLLRLVRDGFGVAALPRVCVEEAVRRGELQSLGLAPPPPLDLGLCLGPAPAAAARAVAAQVRALGGAAAPR